MKTLLLFITILISVPAISQDTLETEKKEDLIETEKKEKDLLKKMAKQKATELQKELNLTNYTSMVVQKAIYEYSVKANKVIQSNMSREEKSKSLSNIIYFQNRKLKEVLTVKQFYQYLGLTGDNYASF